MKIYDLVRDDETVAETVVFADGRVVLAWIFDPKSIEIYPTEQDLRDVREASGRSRLIEKTS